MGGSLVDKLSTTDMISHRETQLKIVVFPRSVHVLTYARYIGFQRSVSL